MLQKKIKIGFVGSVNAMPMHYALKFKEEGFEVKYIVESSISLHRPESHFKSISYPYPNWIKEIPFVDHPLIKLFPKLFMHKVLVELKDCNIIFFNGYGFNIARLFKDDIIKIALFSGSDLDVSCDLKRFDNYKNSDNNWISKLKKSILMKITKNYISGIKSCNVVSYFPKGMNPKGDSLLQEIFKNKPVNFIERYDVNFKELNIEYIGSIKNNKLVILSPVRFLINTEEYNTFEYKGNDLIIQALGKFYQENKNIEVHFIEKGPKKDILLAKDLCDELNLSNIITWHKEMSLDKLFKLYKKSDIVFDQVGNHWIGAVGFYALYMGKPLIANARLDVFSKNWGSNIPILNANTVEDIYKQLVRCQDYNFRESIGKQSHDFAIDKIDTTHIYQQYKKVILSSCQKENLK